MCSFIRRCPVGISDRAINGCPEIRVSAVKLWWYFPFALLLSCLCLFLRPSLSLFVLLLRLFPLLCFCISSHPSLFYLSSVIPSIFLFSRLSNVRLLIFFFFDHSLPFVFLLPPPLFLSFFLSHLLGVISYKNNRNILYDLSTSKLHLCRYQLWVINCSNSKNILSDYSITPKIILIEWSVWCHYLRKQQGYS